MRNFLRVVRNLLYILSVGTLPLLMYSHVSAITSSVPVELTVPETVLKITGKASPDAFVTIKESGSTIASVNADSSGNFTSSIVRTPGLHTITVDYTDTEGVKSLSNTQTISVQPQTETLSNLFLSPTISRGSLGTLVSGSILQLRGYTKPNSLVTLKVDYNAFSFDTDSDSSGFYEFLLDTSLLGEGEHIASVFTTSGASISDVSKSISFNVSAITGPSVPDIVVKPSLLPPPTPLFPSDGSIIDGDRVTINGDSVPNAQINIYENGVQIGSVFSDEFGKWYFDYVATFSPVTLSFETCIDGECSVLSRTVTLVFNGIKATCKVNIKLSEYRFWGIDKNQKLSLDVAELSGGSIIQINWGDGVSEIFDYDENNNRYEHIYKTTGNFNGTITLQDKFSSDCQQTRYFSVVVSGDEIGRYFDDFLLLLIMSAGILVLSYIVSKDKQNTVQNS